MLHYNPRHVSSSTMLIFRRTNCIITASGIVTICKRPYSTPVGSELQSALNRHTLTRQHPLYNSFELQMMGIVVPRNMLSKQ